MATYFLEKGGVDKETFAEYISAESDAEYEDEKCLEQLKRRYVHLQLI